mmetsp:Transcript_22582/g.32466  ORF Transcript_22582/g.32466 Transcript_22582/m.32466 type:complete len:564 (-) Transcript_22582:66-1757(-)
MKLMKKRNDDKLSILGSKFLLQRYGPDPIHTLTGHRGCVNSVLFSECGNLIYTGSDDTNVNIYNVHSGKLIETMNTIHTGNIFYAKDLPETHGATMITCGADGIVVLRDVPTNRQRTIFHHRGRAHRIGIIPHCPDSFISCGEDGLCCLFDIRDSRQSFFSSSIPFDDDTLPGRSLVQKVRFYGHRARECSIYSVGVNPVKPYEIVIGGQTSHVSVFDTRKFVNPVSYLCPTPIAELSSTSHVTGVKFNYAGDTVLASYHNEAVYSMQMDKHTIPSHRIRSGQKSNKRNRDEEIDSSSSIITSLDVDAPSLSADSGYSMKFSGHNNNETVKQVSFLGGRSEFVASGSDCGHIFIWEASTGKLLKLLNADETGAVNCLSAHPHFPYVASSGLSNDAKLWGPNGDYSPLVEGSEALEYANTVMHNNNMSFGENERSRFVHLLMRRLVGSANVGFLNMVVPLFYRRDDQSSYSNNDSDSNDHEENGDGFDDDTDEGEEQQVDYVTMEILEDQTSKDDEHECSDDDDGDNNNNEDDVHADERVEMEPDTATEGLVGDIQQMDDDNGA